MVRDRGFEPLRFSAMEPKSIVSAYSTNPANINRGREQLSPSPPILFTSSDDPEDHMHNPLSQPDLFEQHPYCSFKVLFQYAD